MHLEKLYLCGICCYIFAGRATLHKSGTLKNIKKKTDAVCVVTHFSEDLSVAVSTLLLCYAKLHAFNA